MYNGHGLEIEQPYHDRRLVDYVMALPADQLGRPQRDRWVHRNAMSGLLPEAVCERTYTTHFLPLLEKGLLDRERTTVETMMHDPQIVRRELVRAEWLQEQLAEDWVRSPDSYLVWLCISLELWLRHYGANV
jgi:asparagine synthase (glutamine-hydrolysing)